jgi:hypothetical protein
MAMSPAWLCRCPSGPAARVIGITGLGEGAPADAVIYDADLRRDLSQLAAPRGVVLRGKSNSGDPDSRMTRSLPTCRVSTCSPSSICSSRSPCIGWPVLPDPGQGQRRFDRERAIQVIPSCTSSIGTSSPTEERVVPARTLVPSRARTVFGRPVAAGICRPARDSRRGPSQ